jgi:hypothetical protein
MRQRSRNRALHARSEIPTGRVGITLPSFGGSSKLRGLFRTASNVLDLQRFFTELGREMMPADADRCEPMGRAQWQNPVSGFAQNPSRFTDDPTRKDPEKMAQIVIASGLGDGRVVFLAKGSKAGEVVWAALIGDSEVAAEGAPANALLGMAEADADARHLIVDPYLIDVEGEGATLTPTKYREVIRCLGPTIRLDLGKQAEGAEA